MMLTNLATTAGVESYIVARPTLPFLLVGGIIFILSIYISNLTGKRAAARWKGNEARVAAISNLIMGCVSLASLLVYGVSMQTLQGIALCCIFLYSSYGDIKVREADDWIHVMLVLASLIGGDITDIPAMLVSMLLIGGAMLLTAVISKGGGLGGADIKLAAATSLMLGVEKALIGTCVGMILAVIHNLWKKKKTGKAEGFPLIPYLAIGYMAAFFIK